MSICLFASDAEMTERRLDEKDGFVETKYNPKKEAEKLGVKCVEMPTGYVVYKRKGQPVHLDELGSFVLARVEDGQILNKFNGQRLDRIQVLTLQQVHKLRSIFGNKKALL